MNKRMKIICPECKEPKGLFKVFLKVTEEEEGVRNLKTLVCYSCEHLFTFTEVE